MDQNPENTGIVDINLDKFKKTYPGLVELLSKVKENTDHKLSPDDTDVFLADIKQVTRALWDEKGPIGREIAGDYEIILPLISGCGLDLPGLIIAEDFLNTPKAEKVLGGKALSTKLSKICTNILDNAQGQIPKYNVDIKKIRDITATHIDAARKGGYLHLPTREAVTDRVTQLKAQNSTPLVK